MLFKKIITALLFTFFTFVSFASYGKSPVYKISKGDDYLYVGGTIHLLSPNDYPLPSGFDKAFDDAKQVFFEMDSDALTDPATQAKMASVMTLKNGQTLKTVLNEGVYNELVAFMAERQLPIQAFSQFTPAGVSITLTLFELQRLGLGNPQSGVDRFFHLKTKKLDSKSDGFLETVDQQISFLDSFNQVDPNVLMKSSLKDLATLQSNWKDGLNAWRNGDMTALSIALGANEMRTEFPIVYKTLLTDRNKRWLVQMKKMLETRDVELMLVGAMHLVGDDGVIELMRDQGYNVEQLD